VELGVRRDAEELLTEERSRRRSDERLRGVMSDAERNAV
jgi:hypothetical protein